MHLPGPDLGVDTPVKHVPCELGTIWNASTDWEGKTAKSICPHNEEEPVLSAD